jgi:hypothetical protein
VIESDLKANLRQAENHDVSVNVLLAPHIFPDWAYEEWPDLKADEPGHFIDYVIDHPKARELLAAHIRTAVPAMADFESLHSIGLSNEPGYRSTSDRWTQADWPAYLQERYDSIGALNETYGSDFGSFDAVPAGKNNLDPHPRTYDWMQFNNERFTAFHEWMANIVKEEAPDVPVHAKIMGHAIERRNSLIHNGIDPERFAAVTDINGNDDHVWPDKTPGMYPEYVGFYDLQTSFQEAPVYNSENHLIRNEDANYEPDMADHLRLSHWQGAIHRQGASTMWLWERTYDLEAHGGQAGSILNRPDGVAAIGHTTLDMNRLGAEIAALQDVPAAVGVLYSPAANVFAEGYQAALDKAYRGFSYEGKRVGFVSERQIRDGALAEYESIVLPAASHIQRETAAPLARAAAGDTTVVTIGDPPARDTRDRPLPEGPRATLADNVDRLAADAGRTRVRTALRERLREQGLQPVRVTGSGGSPLSHVEYRSATHDGRLLVNVANYTSESVTVQVRHTEGSLTNGRELIADTATGTSYRLDGRAPALLSFEP